MECWRSFQIWAFKKWMTWSYIFKLYFVTHCYTRVIAKKEKTKIFLLTNVHTHMNQNNLLLYKYITTIFNGSAQDFAVPNHSEKKNLSVVRLYSVYPFSKNCLKFLVSSIPCQTHLSARYGKFGEFSSPRYLYFLPTHV